MSVIAVRKYKNKISISADEQTSWGDNKFNSNDGKMFINRGKLFKTNNAIIGVAGSVEESTMFRVYTETHLMENASISGVMNFLVEFGEWGKKKNGNFQIGNHYIIIFKSRIFQCIGLEVSEVGEFNAIGSGGFIALGAMYMGASPAKAVEVAKEYDLYCSGKTITFETKLL